MGKIILARHGQDEDNAKHIFNGRRNAKLTVEGGRQAFELACTLLNSDFKIKHVFSSTYWRAIQTGSICAAMLCLTDPVTILDYLVERNHGVLEGRLYSDVWRLSKQYRRVDGFDYVIEAKGAESYPQLYVRAATVHSRLLRETQDRKINGDVLVVGHSALLKMVEVCHKGLSWEHTFDNPRWGNCEYRVLE